MTQNEDGQDGTGTTQLRARSMPYKLIRRTHFTTMVGPQVRDARQLGCTARTRDARYCALPIRASMTDTVAARTSHNTCDSVRIEVVRENGIITVK